MISRGPTIAPAGSISIFKDPPVKAATSSPNFPSITASSDVFDRTDWMRRTFSAKAEVAVMESATATAVAVLRLNICFILP